MKREGSLRQKPKLPEMSHDRILSLQSFLNLCCTGLSKAKGTGKKNRLDKKG